MDKNQIRLKILEISYKIYYDEELWNTPNGYTKPADFEDFGADPVALRREADYLISHGYLEVHSYAKKMAYQYGVPLSRITTKGIDYIDGPSPFHIPHLRTLLDDSQIDDDTRSKILVVANELKEDPSPTNTNQFLELLNENAPWIGKVFGGFVKGFVD